MLVIGMYLLREKTPCCHLGKVTLRELSKETDTTAPLLLTKQQ